ncbi:hypothetical protein NQ314_005460 [Rhamnusium bicolor]|uniref:Uncharacterized protein n=1 Tax=Rhamnusium bicolor TaxID=1586634 RepID=A0AAV8ZI04_9CUCU|nr:hypothetical protein NQ314_005460 [Rhamnusium bicolor]
MSHPILPGENGKDLPSNYNFDLLGRKRRPSSGGGSGCNFNGNKGGKYRTDETGRTFFDLQLINVGYHHSYNINCGGGGPPEGGHPIGGGINKPILGGGLHQQGGQQQEGQHHEGGLFANRPILSMLLGNRPLQGLFSQSQLQSQSQTGGQGINSNIPMTPVTQPTNPGGGMVTPVGPDPITDPDDTIYNDNIKPVHEDHDPVTDPYNNKLPPGQYLVASHPVFGTHTQDLSEFDYINPFKIHKKFKEEVTDFFSDLFAFRR